MSLAANVIWVLHLLFIVFMIVAPFTKSQELVALHFLIVPFLYVHWLTNDATCCLTILEKNLRGCTDDCTFFYQLLSPVYKFHEQDINYGVWLGSVLLWLVSWYRMHKEKYATVKEIFSRMPFANKLMSKPA